PSSPPTGLARATSCPRSTDRPLLTRSWRRERSLLASPPPDVAAPPATAPPFDARTRVLLEAPIASTLVRLATPNVLVMLAQASVGLMETYFVARLGTDALAGVAL